MSWTEVCTTDDILENGGGCVNVDGVHIAIFNYDHGSEWFAVQNVCPHKKQSILSRGIIGDDNGEPKVACPLHKRTFCLKTGVGLSDPELRIATFPVEVRDAEVYVELPVD